jgi:hypothetical protein
MNELFKVVEELIPDAVVADYYVKEAATPMRLHEVGQKGAALTEEQAGRGWLVSMTEWISRDKCVRLPRMSVCVGLHLCVSASQVTNSDRYGAGLHVGTKADHIVVHNRATGLLEEETIDPALAFSMKALYQTCVDIYLSSPAFSSHTQSVAALIAVSVLTCARRTMGAGLMSLTAVKALLKKMTDSHGQAFSHPDSKAKMCASSLNHFPAMNFNNV